MVAPAPPVLQKTVTTLLLNFPKVLLTHPHLLHFFRVTSHAYRPPCPFIPLRVSHSIRLRSHTTLLSSHIQSPPLAQVKMCSNRPKRTVKAINKDFGGMDDDPCEAPKRKSKKLSRGAVESEEERRRVQAHLDHYKTVEAEEERRNAELRAENVDDNRVPPRRSGRSSQSSKENGPSTDEPSRVQDQEYKSCKVKEERKNADRSMKAENEDHDWVPEQKRRRGRPSQSNKPKKENNSSGAAGGFKNVGSRGSTGGARKKVRQEAGTTGGDVHSSDLQHDHCYDQRSVPVNQQQQQGSHEVNRMIDDAEFQQPSSQSSSSRRPHGNRSFGGNASNMMNQPGSSSNSHQHSRRSANHAHSQLDRSMSFRSIQQSDLRESSSHPSMPTEETKINAFILTVPDIPDQPMVDHDFVAPAAVEPEYQEPIPKPPSSQSSSSRRAHGNRSFGEGSTNLMNQPEHGSSSNSHQHSQVDRSLSSRSIQQSDTRETSFHPVMPTEETKFNAYILTVPDIPDQPAVDHNFVAPAAVEEQFQEQPLPNHNMNLQNVQWNVTVKQEPVAEVADDEEIVFVGAYNSPAPSRTVANQPVQISSNGNAQVPSAVATGVAVSTGVAVTTGVAVATNVAVTTDVADPNQTRPVAKPRIAKPDYYKTDRGDQLILLPDRPIDISQWKPTDVADWLSIFCDEADKIGEIRERIFTEHVDGVLLSTCLHDVSGRDLKNGLDLKLRAFLKILKNLRMLENERMRQEYEAKLQAQQ
uniref:Telomerase-binding protein EST1A n=1 Tax=Caenorhabditis tropicalis TaxID=1561998 RepID=A0A1I7TN55_9PELO